MNKHAEYYYTSNEGNEYVGNKNASRAVNNEYNKK